ncbi:chromatin-remodeling ATPase INO80 [Aspergillus clavatus NRRL 1]|uniref:Chromatin-remodeling ATPase INO80 n=1 Tax=Aspergillus clavatus (strain ATCC 1007 / CBS 513.65 / DSM 816 / NCTC 3887 / NRRL 1 / QM 1276 / 107) TaxID=344612 RepID=INO80_ASPCL|nr:SNF2 family helicase/ATPase (Ino80), putative [Aspergillus clavatus NRRL 1]A1C9W6.1 RecName: Full=Chromatin-remodeling ATPase INO80 [Aspergillus clavatus NRRL 1]EAW12534.1 SNF2 family helicase/ATPase (Ino80), putative [Aspergillus clavatus NRRL 1]
MTGGPPYNSQSPTQQPRYPVYSPPSKTRPYYPNNDQYQQHPPQTPPAFPPQPPLARSPHYSHAPSPLPATLPPLNGGAPPSHHQESSSQYQAHQSSGTPQFPLPRPYSASVLSSNGASPYNHPTPSHAHPSSGRLDSLSQSPPKKDQESLYPIGGNVASGFSSSIMLSPPCILSDSIQKPARAADPMSFASILSGPTEERPLPRKQSPLPEPAPVQTPAPAPPVLAPVPAARKATPPPPTAPVPVPAPLPEIKEPEPLPTPLPRLEKKPSAEKRRRNVDQESRASESLPVPPTNGVSEPAKVSRASNVRKTMSERDTEAINKIIAEIDNAEKSDVESPGFEAEYERYIAKGKKRALDAEKAESIRRKRRRHDFLVKLGKTFEKQANAGMDRFRVANEASVIAEVQAKEIQDEKERKKDMQRKRRRENTVRLEMQKKIEAERKANKANDAAEKAKFLREAERAQRKIKSTKRALEGVTSPEEIGEVTPLAPNLEGGTTSSFHIGRSSPSRRKSGRSGGSSRPKKSKEQKQAEKDAAEAAYAAMENDEPLPLAPKEDPRKESLKKEAKGARSKEPTPQPLSAFESKGYNQIYEQIWRDIARKDIPKVYRIKALSLSTRQENLRKTAQLASKQSRKWQERTNKSMKDTQARAKRTMREMMSFWKRNEREERDLRRLAEKQEIESAKKAEAEREANRQRRKLNFLISQTELYSHFIGRKIKGAEADASGDAAVDGSDETVRPGKAGDHTIDLPSSVADLSTKVTNFEDLDFDAEDETALRQAAMANAQNAVKEAQDRARAFNAEENPMAALDEGELNFQNPTSLGDIEISQPNMLTAKLKEYQLKGLNWLVNLYEQGINGILADEMGLGKTIQSISVMAYLAEVHNIWGPFLVIAPASTLHNWQQEITKFVPDIKVLPYWGSAKDRKVLRKFWDRKHITYTKESEFHVLVTSYQLVVLDSQYFQKVKWQYMILDEAQAIKSSQSSRWKNLLGFSCRNRLLLTGTPIQNNMQELWALLHFIMPTLFDSHDEFSEWFSKDIESHAQSNTKLNEDQLRRLHMILKPFMLRRVKKHVQQELGDKVEKDVFCDLTYRQRAYYTNLRNRVSIMDLIEKAAVGDEADSTTLMNLVMQFRKVCNHPDLFERAETKSPFSLAHFAETASFVREGQNVDVRYSTRNLIEYDLPRLLFSSSGRLDVAGPDNEKVGFQNKYLQHLMNIFTPENIKRSVEDDGAFSFLRFADTSINEAYEQSHLGVFERAVRRRGQSDRLSQLGVIYDNEGDQTANSVLPHSLFNIVERNDRQAVYDVAPEGYMRDLMTVSESSFERQGLNVIEPCASPAASAPPIFISCSGQTALRETNDTFFSVPVRHALYSTPSRQLEEQILEKKLDPAPFSLPPMLPKPLSAKGRYTHIEVPSMRRFVTDSGKLAKLDELLRELKAGGHRVLLYFQMTRMIDLMEEYLTYRNYKYCRLDGSTKLEDRRDTVADFQQRPDIFVFLLSTRAGGLGINLTAADTVIFYDSDWNPTIDSQAMDRAHRLGQTRQVTVYRLITRGTIEERIRKRALQKEEVQRVVISGGAAGGVDFNTRNRESRTKDIAMWLADDEQAELIEQKEKEALDRGEVFGAGKGGKKAALKRKKDLTLDDMYHEGEGNFDDISAKPSGAATPVSTADNIATPSSTPVPKRGRGRGTVKGSSKRAKTTTERLRLIDGDGGL